MEPREKASYLVVNYQLKCKSLDYNQAIECALIAVDAITKALEEYGQDTMELQNMDREFAWWDKVKQEINLLK